jgi:hypothetical protein
MTVLAVTPLASVVAHVSFTFVTAHGFHPQQCDIVARPGFRNAPPSRVSAVAAHRCLLSRVGPVRGHHDRS